MLVVPAQAQTQRELDTWWRICTDTRALQDDRIRNCDAYIGAQRAPQARRADAHFIRGRIRFDDGDTDDAIEDYNEAVRLNPNHHGAYNARGIARRNRDDLNAALADFNQAIRSSPQTNPSFPSYLTNRCLTLAFLGKDLAQARADCDRSLALGGRNAGTLESRGLVFLRLNQLDNAIADFDEALRINSQLAGSLYGRGIAKLWKGDIAGGNADLAAATAISRGIAERFARLGFRLPETGPPIQLPPLNIAELRRLCESNETPLDDRIKACSAIIDAAGAPPQDRAAAYFNRGSILRGDIDRAIADFTEAIRLNPRFTDAYIERGLLHDERGDFDRAIADFTQAINLDRTRDRSYFLRGQSLTKKGQFDSAIVDFTEVIKISPNDLFAHSNRGLAYQAKGDYNRAIADFDTAIKIHPGDAAAYYDRGRSHLYAGNPGRAWADLNQAGELDSANARTNVRARYALWAEIAARRAKATSRLKQALAAIDKSAWPAPMVLLFLGQVSEVSVVTAAFDSNPTTHREQLCEANFLIGHWKLGQDKRDAARLFRNAANDCPIYFMERNAARVELRTLGETP